MILDDPHGFQGLIKGLVEASSEAAENYIDLKGFSYTSETKVMSASYNPTTNITEVTITNGNSANNITIALSGDYHSRDIEFASDESGGTLFSDPSANSGTVTIGSGTTLDICAASTATVSFTNGDGKPTYGELVLGDAVDFTGQISGFAGTAPDTAHSDAIDLEGINYNSSGFSETYGAAKGLLTVSDGSHSASFTFDNFDGTLSFASDGTGGTLVTDPPTTGSSSASVSISGPGNDTFLFHSGMGAETLANFNPRADTIELDHFANVQNVQELASLISNDGHGGAFIQLEHSVSIDIPGVTASYLQAHLQSLVHLH